MSDKISRLKMSGIQASVIGVKDCSGNPCDDNTDDEFNVDVDFRFCQEKRLRDGQYHIVFTHPDHETLIPSKYGRDLLLSDKYRDNVVAIVIDEAHCIVDWGVDFRQDYAKLGVLCAMYTDIPVLAMTATASQSDIKCILDSLGLKNRKCIIANPDRKNITYKKIFRKGKDADAIQSILIPIASGLLEKKIAYPLTIVYISLRLCGFAYKLFEHVLGNEQYFPPGSPSIPCKMLFAQFYAAQTSQMKEEILKQICSGESIVCVVFATVAMGMGVDIPDIREVMHIGPPSTMKAYFQETGQAGRDGKRSSAWLYYNNRDIAKNREGMQDDMHAFCTSNNICLRKVLLESLDYKQDMFVKPLHLCCGVCEAKCKCHRCLQL